MSEFIYQIHFFNCSWINLIDGWLVKWHFYEIRPICASERKNVIVLKPHSFNKSSIFECFAASPIWFIFIWYPSYIFRTIRVQYSPKNETCCLILFAKDMKFFRFTTDETLLLIIVLNTVRVSSFCYIPGYALKSLFFIDAFN